MYYFQIDYSQVKASATANALYIFLKKVKIKKKILKQRIFKFFSS